MYDVNFVYNALSFLRLTSRSSVNHVFVVLNKHILYLVVAKFPTLLSSPFAGFLLWAQGTENIKVLYHRFSYHWGKEVHEVVVLLLGGFLSTFSEQGLLNGSIKRLPTDIILKGERCLKFSITNNLLKHA